MPPKAKGRRSKSPKLSKAEKEKLKKEEAEIKAREEEEERQKAEQERIEREEREKQKQEELERLREEERASHQAEVDELQDVLQMNMTKLKTYQTEQRAKAKWERYMLCDGTPDPTITMELNTYMNLWREDTQPKPVKEVLQECEQALRLMAELEHFLSAAADEGLTDDDVNRHKENIVKLKELVKIKLDEATMNVLLSAGEHLDPEYQNLQFSASSEHITMCLWGNCAKNPRIKSFTFDEQGMTIDLPKVLANGNIAVRILYTKYDNFSHLAKSYYPRAKKAVVAKPSGVVKGENEEAEKEEKVVEELIEPIASKTPSMASRASKGSRKKSGRRSGGSSKSGRRSRKSSAKSVKSVTSQVDTTKEDQEGIEGEDEKEENVLAEELQVAVDDEEEEDDDDEEDAVDLRAFSAIGRIITIDLLELPPQPKLVNGWIMQQIVSPELKKLPYCAGQGGTAPGSASSSTPALGLSSSATTNTMQAASNAVPIGVSMKLPGDVFFLEQPQIVHWDHQKNLWRLDGQADEKYDEENKIYSFKMDSFSILATMQVDVEVRANAKKTRKLDLHLNMPFQSWELRPHKTNSCVFTIIAAIVEVEIEIKDALCCLKQPAEVGELSHLVGKWLTPKELIKAMQRAGVNIFPTVDTDKYVSIESKDESLEKSLYYEMAVTSSAIAYTWSKWNAECGKDKVVLQAVEQLKDESPLEEDWWLYSIGTYNSSKLKMKEFDDTFSDTMAENSQLHSDLYHMVRDGASPEALKRMEESSFLFVDCVHQLLSASKPITYS